MAVNKIRLINYHLSINCYKLSAMFRCFLIFYTSFYITGKRCLTQKLKVIIGNLVIVAIFDPNTARVITVLEPPRCLIVECKPGSVKVLSLDIEVERKKQCNLKIRVGTRSLQDLPNSCSVQFCIVGQIDSPQRTSIAHRFEAILRKPFFELINRRFRYRLR